MGECVDLSVPGKPISTEIVESRIVLVRGQRVLIDADLATLYGVPTKALNQAVKRNMERFPHDFLFRLTELEKQEVVTNCDRLQKLRFSAALPYAFTEHGTIMAANILSSPHAIRASVLVVRAFVRLREMVASHNVLARRLRALEAKYDGQFKVVFEAIRQLMAVPDPQPRRRIGFISED